MSEGRRMVELARQAFDGGAWHGPSVREVLEGLEAQRAARRPLPAAHSIWELVVHMAFWKDVVRRRLEGERITEVAPADNWPEIIDTSAAAWDRAVAGLQRSHDRLVERMADVPDAQLADTIVSDGDATFTVYATLHGVIQHDLYHAGQIAILNK